MDEEMEYAEMLEIPVSTVNVTKKRGRKPKKSQDLKEKVITKVNDSGAKTDSALPASETAITAQPAADTLPIQPAENDVISESTPIAIPRRKKRPLFARMFGKDENEWEFDAETAEAFQSNKENPLPAYNYATWENPEPQEEATSRRNALIVGIEFAACFALCLGIFLTNVFMPNSAINTFFRSLGATESTDARTYSDFKLSAFLSEEDAELTLSPTGIISFTEAGCVYPAVDGTVETLTQNSDGTWTIKIAHSDTFSEIISGLSYPSCSVGSSVKSNVPIGYSDGNAEVQVSMYEDGALLNCFQLTESGDLAWIE